jgi:hypothetical protein
LFSFFVRSEGFTRQSERSLSFIALAFPPKAAILAELGRFRNAYVYDPPICAERSDRMIESRIKVIKSLFKISV